MATFRNKCSSALQIIIHFWLLNATSKSLGFSELDFRTVDLISPADWPNQIPCPDPDLIKPCECILDEDYLMYMECSEVESEDQLKNIFSHKFPFTQFRSLNINNNTNLKVLRAGDLGNSSFVDININNSNLNEIEDTALINSHNTLQSLCLDDNKLWAVPNGDLSSYNKLIHLSVQRNAFTLFPRLISPTLQVLIMDGNNFETIPVNAITDLESLEVISLQQCSLRNILSDTFAMNQHLSVVNLSSNNLTNVTNGTVHLHGPNSQLGLRNNHIAHIPHGSFSGVKIFMDMEQNSLEYLHEEVWRSLLEDNVYLTLEGNPFLCDCDLAWLIVNRTLLSRVVGTPRCSDGEAFVELDPVIYEEYC